MTESPSQSTWRIAGGRVFDPAAGVVDRVGDVWIAGGRVVEPPHDRTGGRTLDATGLVVMPGGVDMHSHIAGPKVNTARKMRPEATLAAGGLAPAAETAARYAALGYTTVFDAAVPPLGALHADEELEDARGIDSGYFITASDNRYALEALRRGDQRELRHYLAWLLARTGGYALKLVNPGRVEAWKSGSLDLTLGIDEPTPHYGVTSRQIMQGLCRAADELALPHSAHIHGVGLGLPGNWRTTLASMQATAGARAHFAHVQFHSYAGGEDDDVGFGSGVGELVDYVNAHPETTIDVGQVMFGPTTSMTGDAPLGRTLHQVFRTKWSGTDVENEGGCGIAPIEYRRRSVVHAWQWAIGLEWFLLMNDPWRIALTTDHPNGASFMAYPELIHLLMSADRRREALAALPPAVAERSLVRDLKREYSLEEICIITRAGPARMLGLARKGTLAPGADADVTIYSPQDDFAEMFRRPRYVLKSGRLIVQDGELLGDLHDPRTAPLGERLRASPAEDAEFAVHMERWFAEHYSLRADSFALPPGVAS